MTDADVVTEFHKIAYRERFFTGTWGGVPLWQYPTDIMVLQELMWRIKPALVLETGTLFGGSALFFAHMMDAIGGSGEVITIDKENRPTLPRHRRITYLVGSSTSDETERKTRRILRPEDSVLVMLDSAHGKEHVLMEMRTYAHRVTPGSYMVVQDSNINGHPVLPEYGPGPMEAITEFLGEHMEFMPDKSCERYLITACPNGWLLKTRG